MKILFVLQWLSCNTFSYRYVFVICGCMCIHLFNLFRHVNYGNVFQKELVKFYMRKEENLNLIRTYCCRGLTDLKYSLMTQLCNVKSRSVTSVKHSGVFVSYCSWINEQIVCSRPTICWNRVEKKNTNTSTFATHYNKFRHDISCPCTNPKCLR
jgi:hypothetical protein